MMNWSRFITPLRLMIIDDESGYNKMPAKLRQAADEAGIRCEIISCKKAVEAQETLQGLNRAGKKIHAVSMDYRLGIDDIGPIEFLDNYIDQNPDGYWFWASAFPAEAYKFLLASSNNEKVHARMLTGYDKSNNGFGPSLRLLMSRLQGDLYKFTEQEAKALILTKRDTLKVVEGSLIRKEHDQEFSILDELVPGCDLFDNAVIIHVPLFPDKTSCFADAIIPKQSGSRVSTSEQHVLRNAWVARKYFESVQVMTANQVSKDFDSNNWRKYATQFNLNLIWLDAASESVWSGSILVPCEGGTKLNERLNSVNRAKDSGAVWSNIAPRNFNSQFRPWAAVYRSLKAPAFFEGIDVNSGELKGCDESLPLEAALGSINMRVSPDAKLYIDRGNHLYDVRRRAEAPFQPSASVAQTTTSFSSSTAQPKLTTTSEETQETAKAITSRRLSKKLPAKGRAVRRGGR